MAEQRNEEMFKLLLDEKFSSLHTKIDEKFLTVNNTLENIKVQVVKTNSRVTHLEEDVNGLKIKEVSHSVNCPQNIRFIKLEENISELKEDIDDKLKDISFFIRNPRLGLAIIIVSVIVSLLAYFEIKPIIVNHPTTKIEATK